MSPTSPLYLSIAILVTFVTGCLVYIFNDTGDGHASIGLPGALISLAAGAFWPFTLAFLVLGAAIELFEWIVRKWPWRTLTWILAWPVLLLERLQDHLHRTRE